MSLPILVAPTCRSIGRASDILRSGGLVAFPTETVYGLGADATSVTAIERLFKVKNRPACNPLIIHLATIDRLSSLAQVDDRTVFLAESLWPGPLTLVLRRSDDCPVASIACATSSTIAVRIPAHPVALALLKKVAKPIAAPSANISGTVSPTIPLHVTESLGNRVDMILAAGRCQIGIESTVVDLTQEIPMILRPGAITQEMLNSLIGPVQTYIPVSGRSDDVLKSPGQLLRHYAPSIPLHLNVTDFHDGAAVIAFGPDTFIRGGYTRLNLSVTGDLDEAAMNLYSMLRALDQPQYRMIDVMPIPEQGLGIAINDRLRRAAALKPS